MNKKKIKKSTKAIQQLVDSGVVISLFKEALNMRKASDKKVKKIVAKMVIKQLKKLEDKKNGVYIAEEGNDQPTWQSYVPHDSDKTDEDRLNEINSTLLGG